MGSISRHNFCYNRPENPPAQLGSITHNPVLNSHRNAWRAAPERAADAGGVMIGRIFASIRRGVFKSDSILIIVLSPFQEHWLLIRNIPMFSLDSHLLLFLKQWTRHIADVD